MKAINLNTTLLLLALAATLSSCKKDEITVEKNDSTTWEYDKKVIEDDIRTRLGYDPRAAYAYFKETEATINMYKLGDVPLTGENTTKVEVKLLGAPATEPLQVSIAYDAAYFEKIKAQYPDYKLGDASLIKLPEATKAIEKGNTAAFFDLVTENNANLAQPLILPFALKSENQKLKVSDVHDHILVKIEKSEVQIGAPQVEFYQNNYVVNGKLKTKNTTISVPIGSNVYLPSGISVGLERNADATIPSGYTLAPEGIEGTLPKVRFQEKNHNLTFNIDQSYLSTTFVNYVLPLKWVIYTADGTAYNLTDNELWAYISVKERVLRANRRNIDYVDLTAPVGTKVDKTGMRVVPLSADATVDLPNMIDGDENTSGQFNDQTSRGSQQLHFVFPEEKYIKSLRLEVPEATPIRAFKIWAGKIFGEGKIQGSAIYGIEAKGEVLIVFKNPIPVRDIILGEFKTMRKEKDFQISEIDFYEVDE